MFQRLHQISEGTITVSTLLTRPCDLWMEDAAAGRQRRRWRENRPTLPERPLQARSCDRTAKLQEKLKLQVLDERWTPHNKLRARFESCHNDKCPDTPHVCISSDGLSTAVNSSLHAPVVCRTSRGVCKAGTVPRRRRTVHCDTTSVASSDANMCESVRGA